MSLRLRKCQHLPLLPLPPPKPSPPPSPNQRVRRRRKKEKERVKEGVEVSLVAQIEPKKLSEGTSGGHIYIQRLPSTFKLIKNANEWKSTKQLDTLYWSYTISPLIPGTRFPLIWLDPSLLLMETTPSWSSSTSSPNDWYLNLSLLDSLLLEWPRYTKEEYLANGESLRRSYQTVVEVVTSVQSYSYFIHNYKSSRHQYTSSIPIRNSNILLIHIHVRLQICKHVDPLFLCRPVVPRLLVCSLCPTNPPLNVKSQPKVC